MQVHVLVRVRMIQRQAGGAESLELRADFRRELPSDVRAEEIVHAEAELVRRETTLRVDKVRYRFGRQRRRAFDYDQV